jgi:hypothetical protein
MKVILTDKLSLACNIDKCSNSSYAIQEKMNCTYELNLALDYF